MFRGVPQDLWLNGSCTSSFFVWCPETSVIVLKKQLLHVRERISFWSQWSALGSFTLFNWQVTCFNGFIAHVASQWDFNSKLVAPHPGGAGDVVDKHAFDKEMLWPSMDRFWTRVRSNSKVWHTVYQLWLWWARRARKYDWCTCDNVPITCWLFYRRLVFFFYLRKHWRTEKIWDCLESSKKQIRAREEEELIYWSLADIRPW